jgi:alanine-glyoxylate transaminase/serine-glyoxylate transaminase/serine-pyruvate transaminase
MAGREFIQNPGPTNIPDEVLEAFRRPPMDFESAPFTRLVDGIWKELPVLFGGAHHVFVLTSVGHGAWESVLTNILAPGERGLFAVGGLFGQRWSDMAEHLGYRVTTTPMDMRRAPDPKHIHDALVADTHHEIKAVFVAQTETSTGTVADIAAIRRAIDAADHPALFVVDAIGSFGSELLPMAELGVDVVAAASQKALMMPPGLSFCAVNQRALEIAHTRPTPAWYFAWPPRLSSEAVYYRFAGTPPVQHIYALRAALDLIADEGGIEAVAGRHRRFAEAVHACVEGWAGDGPWEINAVEPSERAAGVTCVRTGDIDGDALVSAARDRFHVSMGGGMLDLRGRAFRMGHLGDLNEPMLLGALGGVETAMEALGLPHGQGLAAAVAHLGSTA